MVCSMVKSIAQQAAGVLEHATLNPLARMKSRASG